MKKVLITGINSYIGTSFKEYANKNYPNEYEFDSISLRDENWQKQSFAGYDAVFHVAGIAHLDSGKINEEHKALYYRVNTDLSIEAATKAKKDGARQFIFMSSSIVYGDCAPMGNRKVVGRETSISPANCYGDSKAKAEEGIRKLEGNGFNIVILRPPMIYGKGCKGNYNALSKIAKTVFLFPKVDNSRSMLYVENLAEFVHLMIKNNESGIFFPQNADYSNTSEMVKTISEIKGKNVVLTKAFNWLLYACRGLTPLIDKAFGSFQYEQSISNYKQPYQIYGLKESIERTER